MDNENLTHGCPTLGQTLFLCFPVSNIIAWTVFVAHLVCDAVAG